MCYTILDPHKFLLLRYRDDVLADNSDDEKCMYKAELHAGQKHKAAEAAKNKAKKGTSARPVFACYPVARSDGFALSSQNNSPLVLSAQPLHSVQGVLPSGQGTPALVTSLGSCFLYGKLGHFHQPCPLLQNSYQLRVLVLQSKRVASGKVVSFGLR